MDDYYFTIKKESLAEVKIKSSKFIGQTYLVESTESIQSILVEIKKKEYNAKHNCYAYIIGHGNQQTFKYSDDGEPSGTAGKPIFDILEGNNLTNILLVVTRYFGGTKLGTGGLVRAYSETAKSVLEKSIITKKYLTYTFHFEIEFSHYNSLQKLMEKYNAKVITSDFSDIVKIKLEIRKSMVESFKDKVAELTSGKVLFDE